MVYDRAGDTACLSAVAGLHTLHTSLLYERAINDNGLHRTRPASHTDQALSSVQLVLLLGHAHVQSGYHSSIWSDLTV